MKLNSGNPDTSLSYVQSDSRLIGLNDLFIPPIYPEMDVDPYIKDSFERKASAILVNKKYLRKEPLPPFPCVLETEISLGEMHGKIASFLAGEPSKKLKIVGITGTNGKTSLTYLLFQLAKRLGYSAGLIGTIFNRINDTVLDANYTTPDASSLNLLLSKMLSEGVQYVFMEMSSHGLKLGRVAGLQVQGVGFTNLTQDHMDFHETMEDYFESKFGIFKLLEQSKIPNKFGVIDMEAPYGKQMWERILQEGFKSEISRLGAYGEARISHAKYGISQTQFRFHKKSKSSPEIKVRTVRTSLLGKFNVSNLSLALLVAMELGWSQEAIFSSVSKLSPVPGRFEVILGYNDNIAIVDYAHSPDALENVLKSVKEIGAGNIICLFGCGGDRDRTKRPVMARVVEALSDFAILTSDNPRNEDPELILSEVESGFSKGFKRYERIVDREKAISRGVELLPPNGVLVIAGKGHEQYQLIKSQKLPFSDKEIVQEYFRKKRNTSIS